MRTRIVRLICCIGLGFAVLGLVGCAVTAQQHRMGPNQINSPLDAMQSTPAPRSGDANRASNGLGSDVEQLQNARTTYERAKQRQRAQIKRKQAKCQRSKHKKEVPINEAGQTHTTFCEQTH